jgi:hypothetical protein
MEQDNPAFNKSEDLDQDRNENFRHDNDLQEPPSVFEGGFSSVNTNYENIPLDENSVKKGRPPKPKYYFDVFTGSVIDRKFYKYFERSGVNPENVRDLGVLLRETQVPLRPLSYRKLDSSKTAKEMQADASEEPIEAEKYNMQRYWNWPEERYKRYGRWLNKAAASNEGFAKYNLTKPIVLQAARLGLGPGRRGVENFYGSFTGFYKSIEITQTQMKGQFDDWTIDRFIKHLQWVEDQCGQRPTREVINDFARSKPWVYPTARIIAERIGGGQNLGPALELAGYLDIRNWEESDYLDWGVKFMKANNGLAISTPSLDYVSKKHLGPSPTSVADFFGIRNFTSKVKKQYEVEIAVEKNRKEQKLLELYKLLEIGSLPESLFENAKSEDDLILFYSKYIVINHLCPDWEESTKIIVSTRGFQDAGFIRSIRKLNNAITAGDIESAALYLDTFDEIWPLNEYMEKFKLGEDYKEFYESRLKYENQFKTDRRKVLAKNK